MLDDSMSRHVCRNPAKKRAFWRTLHRDLERTCQKLNAREHFLGFWLLFQAVVCHVFIRYVHLGYTFAGFLTKQTSST
ncbi:uncharacterized [Tachysurus ichikawai]